MNTRVRSTSIPPLGPVAMIGSANSTLSEYAFSTATASGLSFLALNRTLRRCSISLSSTLRKFHSMSSSPVDQDMPPMIGIWLIPRAIVGRTIKSRPRCAGLISASSSWSLWYRVHMPVTLVLPSIS